LNSRFSSKHAFHVHVTAQASSGNVIVISLFIRPPSLEIGLSLPSVRRTVAYAENLHGGFHSV